MGGVVEKNRSPKRTHGPHCPERYKSMVIKALNIYNLYRPEESSHDGNVLNGDTVECGKSNKQSRLQNPDYRCLTNQISDASSTGPGRSTPLIPLTPNPTTDSFSTTNVASPASSSVEKGVEFFP